MVGSKFFYYFVGLALLLFVVGFLSIFHGSTTIGGQGRLWQETARPSTQQPATMKPGNRWDADFGEFIEGQSAQYLSEVFELVGVVRSDESHAIIRIKDPKDDQVGEIIRVTSGSDLGDGVKITNIEESRITLKLGDERIVLSLYENSGPENE